MKERIIILVLILTTADLASGHCIIKDPAGISSSDVRIADQLPVPLSNGRRIRGVNPRELHPIGIYANIGGPALLGGAMDYFLNSYIELEAGGGMDAVFAGIHYHFTGIRSVPWTPYAGIMATFIYEGNIPGLYIPGGFQMIQVSGFGLRFEVALWIHQMETSTSDAPFADLEFFGSFRFAIGFHF